MAEQVLQRPCAVPAAVAVNRAVQWLSEHGYQVSARSDLEASLFHPGGLDPEPPRHRMKVSADGATLTLSYQPASIFDAGPSTADLARFERVFRNVLDAVADGSVLSYQEWNDEQKDLNEPAKKPGAPPSFCPECGTRAEPGATACALCGAKL